MVTDEIAIVWAERLQQHRADLEHLLMLAGVCSGGLDDVIDRIDALAHDMKQQALR